MVHGMRNQEWEHTAHILAMLVNTHKSSGKPVTPDEMNAYKKARLGDFNMLQAKALVKAKQAQIKGEERGGNF